MKKVWILMVGKKPVGVFEKFSKAQNYERMTSIKIPSYVNIKVKIVEVDFIK